MSIQIGDRKVGPGHPVWIVAEISCNHAGSLRRARALVWAAAKAGADAVKFQMFDPGDLTMDSTHLGYRLAHGPWAGKRLWDLYRRAETPLWWLKGLFRLARGLDLEPFCSVFRPTGLAYAEIGLGVQVLKIASPEVSWPELVKECAATGLPVILSDGMATAPQLAAALDLLQGDGVLLHCVSEYPAPPESYRLQLLADLAQTILPVGLSDHTLGHDVAVAAVALGACVVEKHLMLDRWHYGLRLPLDAGHSLTPGQFAEMVQAIRATEKAMSGPAILGRTEEAGAQWRRRLVFASGRDPGQLIRDHHVTVKRCGMGLEPERMGQVLGRRLAKSVERGDPVTTEVLV